MLALGCALAALGCERRTPSSGLLDVSGVESGILERGDALRVVGAGFPAGRDGEVVLRGVLRQPGEAARSVRLSMVGHARSAERVELVLDAQAHAALGGRGSFDGSLELRFAAARGQGDVIGQLAHVEIDLLQSSDETTREDQALRERAQELLTRTGITAADADTLHGLGVASVALDSSAQRAGLRSGDVIIASAGVRVHALSDLAPPLDASSMLLHVRRPEASAALLLTLPLTASSAFNLDASSTRLCALLSFVLLVLLFVTPLGSPSPAILRVLSTLRAASAAPSQPMSARRWLASLPSLGVISLVLGCACVSSGTLELGGLVAQQGALPWAWKVFSHPELCVGFALFVVYGARLCLNVAHVPALSLLARGLLAALAACVFLGGYAPLERADAAVTFAAGMGAVLFMGKTAALVWLLDRARAFSQESQVLRTLLGCACLALGTLVWSQVQAPHVIEALVSRVLLPTSVLGALCAWLQIRSARKPDLRVSAAQL